MDPETGRVTLLDYVAVQDVGRALNPALVEGQMAGGAVQGIGRALVEALVHDDAGQLLTGTLMDYALPRASMLPPIETHWLEIPAPEGPFGARGMAEAPVLPAPAAIANAIAAATGAAPPRAPDDLGAGVGGAPGRLVRLMRSSPAAVPVARAAVYPVAPRAPLDRWFRAPDARLTCLAPGHADPPRRFTM